jgi:hypothetical protein
MDNWTIEYYETADGYSPVREYIEALPEQDAAQVTFEIDLLEVLEPDLACRTFGQFTGHGCGS